MTNISPNPIQQQSPVRPFVSALWKDLPKNISQDLAASITKGAEASQKSPKVFFRADDIGVPSSLFSAMINAFAHSNVPLGLAVVPAWLTPLRWETICNNIQTASPLWCWHQHGWRHTNHEKQGRKYEFGPSRSAPAKHNDILAGRKKLEALMGSDFTPIFTPPWNRVDNDTLCSLQQLQYLAVSRTQGAAPPSPNSLTDIYINVDLHTRREPSPQKAWTGFLLELEYALATGHCGIMLHHQRMNRHAVAFLPILFTELRANKRISLVSMSEMVL